MLHCFIQLSGFIVLGNELSLSRDNNRYHMCIRERKKEYHPVEGWGHRGRGAVHIYLGNVVSKDGGTDRDIKSRTGKATAAFQTLGTIWTSQVISVKTKLRIFNTNIKSVILYALD